MLAPRRPTPPLGPPQGDLLVHLLEGAQDELCKPASEVSRPRLRSLLELAARTSSVAGDPRLDNLKYTFDARGLAQLVVAALAPAGAGAEPVRLRGGGAVMHAHLCRRAAPPGHTALARAAAVC